VKPYDKPFWDFNNGDKKKKSGIIPKIVATYVYASSQGKRTHSARTNDLSLLIVTRFACLWTKFKWKSIVKKAIKPNYENELKSKMTT
jgi:hypothetical protein